MHSPRHSIKALLVAVSLLSLQASTPATAQSCGATGIAVQVLGSGGPELQDKRASSSYLIWDHGKARVIVDAGGGSALRFGQSGAHMSQLDVFLFSHFHIDHSGDFPALVFSSWFEDRNRPLPIYGPSGNQYMPSTTEFVRRPLQRSSRSLALSQRYDRAQSPGNLPAAAAQCRAHPRARPRPAQRRYGPLRRQRHAWRVSRPGLASGDRRQAHRLQRRHQRRRRRPHPARNDADLFIAHNAVPEGATGVERRLHMPPSVIGTTAANAHVKQLVLSHRMLRTLGPEKQQQTQTEIRRQLLRSTPIRQRPRLLSHKVTAARKAASRLPEPARMIGIRRSAGCARNGSNLMPAILKAVESNCTVGVIAATLREALGSTRRVW